MNAKLFLYICKKIKKMESKKIIKKERNIDAILSQVLPQDLVKFGIIPELVGRVPINVTLEMLDREALIRILTEPKSAIVKQYQRNAFGMI